MSASSRPPHSAKSSTSWRITIAAGAYDSNPGLDPGTRVPYIMARTLLNLRVRALIVPRLKQTNSVSHLNDNLA